MVGGGWGRKFLKISENPKKDCQFLKKEFLEKEHSLSIPLHLCVKKRVRKKVKSVNSGLHVLM